MKESIYNDGQVEDKGDTAAANVTGAQVEEKNGHLHVPRQKFILHRIYHLKRIQISTNTSRERFFLTGLELFAEANLILGVKMSFLKS